jgi:hypothetical protein
MGTSHNSEHSRATGQILKTLSLALGLILGLVPTDDLHRFV